MFYNVFFFTRDFKFLKFKLLILLLVIGVPQMIIFINLVMHVCTN